MRHGRAGRGCSPEPPSRRPGREPDRYGRTTITGESLALVLAATGRIVNRVLLGQLEGRGDALPHRHRGLGVQHASAQAVSKLAAVEHAPPRPGRNSRLTTTASSSSTTSACRLHSARAPVSSRVGSPPARTRGPVRVRRRRCAHGAGDLLRVSLARDRDRRVPHPRHRDRPAAGRATVRRFHGGAENRDRTRSVERVPPGPLPGVASADPVSLMSSSYDRRHRDD